MESVTTFPHDTGNLSDITGTVPLVSYEALSETLALADIELRLDFNLGDEDLEASLLVESLEQQYQDMIAMNDEDEDALVSLQSAKEWVACNRSRLGGLFRYLRSLTSEQL